MMTQNAAIRRFVMAHFNDQELRSFCFDYFPEVGQEFTSGMIFSQMVTILIEYCQRRGMGQNLLTALQQERPAPYAQTFPSPSVYVPSYITPSRNPRQIFISHAHQDSALAHRLAEDLKAQGYTIWIAPESLYPGEKWMEAVNRGLEESGFFLLLLTRHAAASRWVQSETNVAIELEHEDAIRFIPIEVEACRLPPLWRSYQRLSMRGDYAVGLQVLLSHLHRRSRVDVDQNTVERSDYKVLPTAENPSLIIYLIDVSASMNQELDKFKKQKRIDVVNDLLYKTVVDMVQSSTFDSVVVPRYRIAMYAYSSQVIDLLGGVKTITELAEMGVPKLTTLDLRDTAGAFLEVEKLLRKELPNIQEAPPPLIVHITDGKYDGANPIPVANRIMNMTVSDGSVLIQNLHIGSLDASIISDVSKWSGFISVEELADECSKQLFNISSPIPESYRVTLNKLGFSLARGARMFFPENIKQLIGSVHAIKISVGYKKTGSNDNHIVKTITQRVSFIRAKGDSNYKIRATADNPALIIYLIDVSSSMEQQLENNKRRIDLVNHLLLISAVKMVQRSTKGVIVAPRYRVAMYAYSSQVIDLLDGIKTVTELAEMGAPKLVTLDMRDTAGAFLEVEKLLKIEIPNIQAIPSPNYEGLRSG